MASPENLIFVNALVSAIGCGVMAGLFYTFSFCVMNALNRQPPAQAASAMQAINETIINPIFFVLFFGSAILCGISIVVSIMYWGIPEAGYLLSGGAVYLMGSLLVTFGINIPMNNTLASYKGDNEKSAAYWPTYFQRWTIWNHLRFVSSLASSVLFVLAIGQ